MQQSSREDEYTLECDGDYRGDEYWKRDDKNSSRWYFWRDWRCRDLIKLITCATGELHDAIVYDTHFEFDRSDPDAVRFVASVALLKAFRTASLSYIWKEPQEYKYKSLLYPFPNNGKVLHIDLIQNDGLLYELKKERETREQTSDGIYIPDMEGRYAQTVMEALRSEIGRSEETNPLIGIQWRDEVVNAHDGLLSAEECEKQEKKARRERFKPFLMVMSWLIVPIIFPVIPQALAVPWVITVIGLIAWSVYYVFRKPHNLYR